MTLMAEDVKQGERIAKLLRTDDGKELIAKIDDLHRRVSGQLKSARELVEVYRYQGRLEAYEQILKMKED